jgi:hypothetical protein
MEPEKFGTQAQGFALSFRPSPLICKLLVYIPVFHQLQLAVVRLVVLNLGEAAAP